MRRALIIGLGGCGCRVVRMVKERVEWRYGGLDKTPFLQLMGVDTALDAGLEGEDLFVHITVSREGYRRLIDDVRQHRDRPDLEPQTWLDVTVIGDKTEVSEGAGGIRMVGRTAFLFPSNFNRTVQLIRQKLDKLRTLTISDASQAFGQTIGLSNELFIYVVATLCAGTGSSAFLDMGYLIKRQAEYLNLPVTTVAIVTLPPLNTTDTIKLRNTYGSLCELDYFSRDGIVYRAKFPDEPRWLERSDRPYNFVYIVAPDRYGKSALPDHFALEAAIAEYLFTDVFLDETKVRDARREDMVSHAFHLKMPDGAPFRFLTFGMSLLQFPVQQIQEACAYQLVKETLSEWLTEREPSVIELEALYREIGISGENPLRQRLLSPEGDPRGQNYDIVAVVRNRLEQAVRNYREPFDLDIVQRQILVGFGEGEVSAEGDIPLGRFKQVIEGNRERLKRTLPNDLMASLCERFLMRLSIGIGAALKAVQKLKEAVTERAKSLKESKPEDTVEFVESQRNRWRDVLESAERDWLLKFPIPYRGLVRRRLLRRWQDAAYEWAMAKLEAHALKEEIAILDELARAIDLIERRLRHLQDYGRAMQQAAQESYEFTLRPPRLPGILIFDEGVVRREYERILPTEEQKQAVMNDLLRDGLREVWEAARVPIERRDENWLDNDLEVQRRAGWLRSEKQIFKRLQDRFWKAFFETAKKRFEGIRERGDVIERFMERATDPEMQLRSLLDEAAVFLPLNDSESNYQQDFIRERQIKRWVFWSWGKDTPTGERGKEFASALQKAAGQTTEQEEFERLSDTTTILVLTEWGGFPLRLIHGVADFVNRISAQERAKMWSRADLPKWLRLTPPDPRCEELLVAAIAWRLAETEEVAGKRALVVGTDRFSTDFPTAVRQVEEDIDTRRRIQHRVIQPYLQQKSGNESTLEQLLDQLLNLTEQDLNMLGIEGLTKEQAKSIALRFIQRTELLRRYYEKRGELAPAIHFATEEDAKKAKYPRAGYYCANCHYYFGISCPKFCPRCQTV